MLGPLSEVIYPRPPATRSRLHLSGSDATDQPGGSYTTAAVALRAKRLYILTFASTRNSGTGSNGAASQSGATWTLINRGANGGDHLATFRCQPTADVSAAAITLSATATLLYGIWAMVEITGAYDDSANNGAAAILTETQVTGNVSTSRITLSTWMPPGGLMVGIWKPGNGALTNPSVVNNNAHTRFADIVDTNGRLTVATARAPQPGGTSSMTARWASPTGHVGQLLGIRTN